ncbi:MAG: S41 family peptidase [Pseudomarimonas sp.]
MMGQRWERICAAVIVLALMPAAAFGQPSPPPDPASVTLKEGESRAVVLSLAEVLRERFAFRERGIAAAREIEALEKRGTFRQARTAGELLALIDAQIAPIVNDRHFRARYMGPEVVAQFSEAPPSAEDVAAFHEEVRLRGGEVPEVRWLAGNVGYLRINMFLDAEPSKEKLAAAMGMLADSGALIIDVRGSPGGEPAGVANVIGHLVSERTATVRTQDPATPSASRTFHAEPRTPGFTKKPVYVLIDKGTGSGAEEFAYDLQAMRRATLVGETTAGAATPGGFRPLAHGFVAFIPMQIVANTVTGTNWEGVGVSPDVNVAAEQSLAQAHRLALETILKEATGIRRAIAEEGLAALQPSPKP